jgi:hypothetical protein
MATTTNYGFEIPDDTDLVKDGALAMRDLGQDVDTQLFTALGGDYPGLRLVKKQTIGTTVASVTVTGAFSATYENYLIKVVGVAMSSNTVLRMKINGSTGTTYQSAGYFIGYGTATLNSNAPAITANGWNVAEFNSANDNNCCDVEVFRPFLSTRTSATSHSQSDNLNSSYHSRDTNAASSTNFTILPAVGTLTGGTIYVYGYGAS